VFDNFFFYPFRYGDDRPAIAFSENHPFHPEYAQVQWIDFVQKKLVPGVYLLPLYKPLPVASVAGPVHILVKGPLKTVDDVELFSFQYPARIEGKTQDL
jgi:hypothetical protein